MKMNKSKKRISFSIYMLKHATIYFYSSNSKIYTHTHTNIL